MKEEVKTYTAADFARYHAGTMPSGEMHILEKAALEDPFLADALEGYVNTTSAESDITELQGRLTQRKNRVNVFFFSSQARNGWWRIAALFIVITGMGYFLYRLNKPNEEKLITKAEVKAFLQKQDSAAFSEIDTIVKDNIAFENLKPPGVEKKALPKPKLQLKREVPITAQEAKMAPASGYLNDLKDTLTGDMASSAGEKKEFDSQLTDKYVLKGRVTDEPGNPIPFAVVANKAKNVKTVADAEGRFSLKSQDSSIIAMASAPGFESKSFTLEKDKQPIVAMNKESGELTNVVVTAIGIGKKTKKLNSVSRELNGKAAGIRAESTPYPSGGQDKFDDYIQEKTVALQNENNTLAGEVSLAFSLSKKGKPEKINVVKSSCKACEEKAINLLENGPDWIGKQNQKQTIVIKF